MFGTPQQAQEPQPQQVQPVLPQQMSLPGLESQQESQPLVTLSDKLQRFIKSDNIAVSLDDKKLEKIGNDVIENATLDDESRQEWKDQLGEALKIAKQVIEEKTTPWPNAANVKIPMTLTGCIQFNSRTFPQLVQNKKAVKVEVLKVNPTEEDVERAKKLSTHMSYQLLKNDSDWLDERDKLLMVLPLVGTVFTKTYFNPITRMPQIDLCLPDEIIINQKAKSVTKAQRITHVLWLTTNDIITRQKAGLFLDIPIKELTASENDTDDIQDEGIAVNTSKPGEKIEDEELQSGMVLHQFHEQHGYLDLDDDGYAEPYIITTHVATKKVIRIVAAYNFDSFVLDKEKKNWIAIEPDSFFTAYKFLPSFDGSFYGMGFSQILYPINSAANSVLNRLLDAGTLSNQQSGFIGKGVRMRKQTMRLRPGEWITVSTAAGIDLSRNIVPIPTKEPSSVLLELLGMLMKMGQEISGVSDVMQGQLPPANTPATTVVNLISEGAKVYGAIQIRLFESGKQEFIKLFNLNKRHIEDNEIFKSAEGVGQISRSDYVDNDYGIEPVANPAMGTEAVQLAIMQALMSIKDDQMLNKQEIYKRFFDTMNIPDSDKLFAPPPPPNAPPPPEVQKLMAETKHLNMKTADILTSIEEKAIKLDLQEKEMIINREEKASLIAERKVNSIIGLRTVATTENQQEIDAQADYVDKLGEEELPDTQDVEQKIQAVEGMAGKETGIQPQQPSSGQEEQPAQEGAPEGAGQLQQSLEDKMEQASPEQEKLPGAKAVPMGE